jgi:hypothetical protein
MTGKIQGVDAASGQPADLGRPIKMVSTGTMQENHRELFPFIFLVGMIINIGSNRHVVIYLQNFLGVGGRRTFGFAEVSADFIPPKNPIFAIA